MYKYAIIIPLLLLISPAFAEEPVVAKAGVYALNVGRFDVGTGSYTLDFYLSIECNQPCSPDFEFMNGRAASTEKLIDNATSKFYRIQANLVQNVDLRDYPFDSHKLTLELEDKRQTKQEFIWAVDKKNSGIDPAVKVVGWALDGWDANVTDHFYEAYGETFSRYEFRILIHRLELASFMKVLLPVFVMVVIALLSHLLRPDKVAQRLGINTSSLLGAVLFHINATSSIPPVGYLTFADKFMIGTYIVLGASLLSTVILLRHTEKGDEKHANKIYKASLVTVPILAMLIYAALFGVGLL